KKRSSMTTLKLKTFIYQLLQIPLVNAAQYTVIAAKRQLISNDY
ncbi:unnamed protein product, partial [Rotaria magnacalcarata]